ncbi:MAG TPA: HAMP domain-containing sensor histidine kinase [Kofleriaceae bacterium]|nr:HAMP domain-containing sensor histidine kinase [Kofleriaceae bacterium]
MDPAGSQGAAPPVGGDRAGPEELSERRDRAWHADRLARERLSAVVTVALGISLVLAWGALDYVIERRWLSFFLAVRAGCAALLVPCGAAIWRARRLGQIRAAIIVALGIIGVAVSIILPRVEHAYPFYVLGYSLAFWGSAVFLSWPVWCAAITYGASLVAYLAAHAEYGARSPAEIWGGLFYLASAALIAGTLVALRFRLERRAFDLGFALGERNEELAQALRKLAAAQAHLVESEKQSALGRMLAGLSHELNNPVNVIANNVEPVRGYVDVLSRVAERCGELRASHPEVDRALVAVAPEEELAFIIGDLRAAIDAIEAGSERMRQVHGDLRAFIRGDTSAAVSGDVTPGLRATVEMLRRGLRSAVEIDAIYGELPPVRHEPGPLNQVFFNLIQNAIDAVGESGSVRVASRVATGAIEIAVSDSGPGVSDRAMAHLFEPFFTTKPPRKGTGLGLAISKQIVERQGGAIELADPRTATFIVRLPIGQA